MNAQSLGLRVGGMLIVAIGIGHIFLPTYGYRAAAAEDMQLAVRNHFYYLGTYAICIFLIAFGALALFASKAPGTAATRVFSAVMAVVWGLRLGLELRYPVELPIFFLEHPHPVLVLVLAVVFGAFMVATLSKTSAPAITPARASRS